MTSGNPHSESAAELWATPEHLPTNGEGAPVEVVDTRAGIQETASRLAEAIEALWSQDRAAA